MPENDAVQTAESRTDRCPDCIPEAVETPLIYHVDQDAESLSCLYACRSCGNTWTTSWYWPAAA